MSTPSLDPLKDASLNILHFENNAAATLQQQGELLQLLQSESSYLNEKQQIVKDAETASDRLIGFNQNFSKRYVEYIKMIVVMVIGLGMMIFMIVLTKMNILSNTMGTILSIVCVSISAIIVAKMYFVIQNRDHMNYDRVLTTAPPDSTFNKANSVALGNNSFCPFNSQNTTWFKEAFPLLYLPSHCSFRMTDIWRSFVAQRIGWTCGWPILFHQSTVCQERNDHNLMNDFRDEISGYNNNAQIIKSLKELKLKDGIENISANIKLCYNALIELGVVGQQEIILLDAWLKDINSFI